MTRKLSTITLYQDTSLDDTYKHVINWQNQNALDTYLDKHNHVSLTGSYQNINKPIRWNTKTETFNDLVNYSYCKIVNIDHDGNTKTYYAYLTNFEYMNDGTTLIYFSIDIWNTYMWDIDLGKAFIKKGFIKEINDAGTDWTDEFDGIRNNKEDIGGDGCEKLIASTPCYFNISKDKSNIEDAKVQFIVFTCQPKDAKSESGTLAGAYSQYLYYVIPFDSTSDKTWGVKVKDKQILAGGQNIKDVYKKLATIPEFAGSSSLIVDSEMYSYIGLEYEIDDKFLNFTGDITASAKEDVLMQITSATRSKFKPQSGICLLPKVSRNVAEAKNSVLAGLNELYARKFGDDFPKKIMFEPFSKMFFTDGKGTNMTADFAQITKRDMLQFTMQRFGGLTQNGKLTYVLNHYNRDDTDDSGSIVTYENKMAIDDAARDVPIVLDNYTMYLQANKNQLANVRANAKMNENLSKEGNLLSVQNQERNMATAQNVMDYQQGRAMGMAKLDAGLGVLGGILNGAKSGGVIGGVLGGVGGAIQGGLNLYKQSYANNTAQNSLAMQQATQAENMRANYAFQNKVATNNYEATIRSQNAMLADTRNHNDVVAHQGTSYLYDFQNKANQMHWQMFTCQDSVMENVILYFNLFGYTINKYDTVAKYINRKTHFNYILTDNANVHGLAPQPALNTINEMLNNGVTIWNDDQASLDKFVNKDYSDNKFR